MTAEPVWARRQFLAAGGAAAFTSLFAPAAWATPRALPPRVIAFHQLHTGEKLDIVYWEKGRYRTDAMHHIAHVLRDFRSGDIHQIDPRLLDLLSAIRHRLGTKAPFEVLSGYRSPATNAMLAAMTEGVATNSQHMYGKAVDIRLPGRSLQALHRAADAVKGGGVGYYPRSDFVHVDVGPVRYW